MKYASRLTSLSSRSTLFLFALALLVAAPVVQAAPLAGTTLTNPGDTVFASLIPPGTDPGTLLDMMLENYSFATTAGTTSGTLRSAVFMNPTGTLDFYYQVANDASSATEIARETNTNFAGWTTWTGYRVDGSTVGGGFVDGTVDPITADRNSPGSVIGFSFFPPDSEKVNPGLASNVLVISTNATEYTIGNASIIDGGTQTVQAFQPVPEPATLAMMGAGLIALAAFRRRRK
jgi:hypothetical protein